ncbi:MAG: hypothetical protein JST54_10185 [Deltaproteobacteria bacterium]|nr:hypothetical protein [Deltaproteobacteria bacterium]
MRATVAMAALAVLAGCSGSNKAASSGSTGTTGVTAATTASGSTTSGGSTDTGSTSAGSTGASSTGASTGSTTAGTASSSSTTAGSTGSSATTATGSSTGTSATNGSSGSSGTPFTPASHPAWTHIPDNGGPVLDAPELLVITFSVDAEGNDGGYPFQADMEGLANFMVGSTWLTAVGAEYGVTSATAATPVRLTDPPPPTLSDSGIRGLLQQGMQAGTIPLPDNSQRIYALFLPADVTVSSPGFNGQGCQDFEGYHWMASLTVNGTSYDVPYAVILDCNLAGAGLTEQQQIEVAASHEFIESSTDPSPQNNPAWELLDTADPWHAFGGEVADLCVSDNMRAFGTTYTVQRSWSNTAAQGDGSPCVPPLTTGSPPTPRVFLGVAPIAPHVVNVTAGQTANITLEGWSTAEHILDWPVAATVVKSDLNLVPTVTPASVNNGTNATLSIPIPSNAPSGDQALLWVYTTQGASNDAQWWPLVLQVQ